VFEMLRWNAHLSGRRYPSISRGLSRKLFKKPVMLDVGKYYFSNRVCDEWNRQPGEIVNVGSVDSFKCRFDQYYRCIRGFK